MTNLSIVVTALVVVMLFSGCTSQQEAPPTVTEDLSGVTPQALSPPPPGTSVPPATDAGTEPAIEATVPPIGEDNTIIGEIAGTDFTQPGEVMITGIGNFPYKPEEVRTVRPNLFQEGHFSVFDILVHLNERGDIQLEYHFDEELDTHVIDGINGETGWWVQAYYSGGWPENNVFRMDHYPHKDQMYLRLYRQRSEIIERIHGTFRAEVARKRKNNGTVIIPDVIIRGPSTNHHFTNVPVTAHDLRSDTYRPGTITAVDVIMSLGDLGKLTYDLKWYDAIGVARIVRSYWVHRIDADESYSTCGFVYEAGEWDFEGFRGNHIHIPADVRPITAPAYVEFFWICL